MAVVRPAVVGGFILSGLALAVAAILLFGGTHLFSPSVHAVVYFQGSVANLIVGAPVTFRGVRVGTVSGHRGDPRYDGSHGPHSGLPGPDPAQIFLQNGIAGQTDAAFDRLLKAGLRAQLDMQSLITGQLRIDLDLQPGAADGDRGRRRGRVEIPSIPSKLQTIEAEIAELPLKEIAENAQSRPCRHP